MRLLSTFYRSAIVAGTSFVVASFSFSYAQDTGNEGVAVYKRTLDIHAALPPSQQALKALIPKEQISRLEVSFSGDRYLIAPVEAEESANVQISVGGAVEYTIVDQTAGEMVRYGNVSDFDYAIRTKIETPDGIRALEETKTINGYQVQGVRMAGTVRNGEAQETEIWFDETVGATAGPLPLATIPGLVVSLRVGDDLIRYELEDIRFEPVESVRFEVPEGHRTITADQLADLREEAIEALTNGSAATVIRQ